MIAVNQATAMRDPCCHVFHHGRGYIHVGHPPMPPKAVAAAGEASPPSPAAHESWHVLIPPQGGKGIALKWLGDKKVWVPVIGTGNRIAFSPAYLAAHGWKYSGPKPL
jgi:hypothetical protein